MYIVYIYIYIYIYCRYGYIGVYQNPRNNKTPAYTKTPVSKKLPHVPIDIILWVLTIYYRDRRKFISSSMGLTHH